MTDRLYTFRVVVHQVDDRSNRSEFTLHAPDAVRAAERVDGVIKRWRDQWDDYVISSLSLVSGVVLLPEPEPAQEPTYMEGMPS